MSQRQGKFRCPECQAAIDLPERNRFDLLPISFFHNSLLSLLAVRQSGDTNSITCSQCRKTNPQMYYCFDCGRFMCLDCFNSHQMLSATFEGHKITPVKDFKGEDYEALLKRQPFCSQQFHKSRDSFARSVKFAFVNLHCHGSSKPQRRFAWQSSTRRKGKHHVWC